MGHPLAVFISVLCLSSITAAPPAPANAPPEPPNDEEGTFQPPTEAEIAAVPADAPDVKALAILAQAEASLTESVTSGELGQVHNEDMFLYAALGHLLKEAQAGGRTHVVAALQGLARSVAELHEAADAFDRAKARTLLEPTTRAFSMVFDFHERARVLAARRLADRFTCPMHPAIVGARTDTCPKCAMALDLPARIRLQPLQGTLAKLVFATIRLDNPLEVGTEVSGVLRLKTRIEEPVKIFELREVHTKKIHLLIIDESLTDYHHEHPVPTDVPGEYRFQFTPRKPGPYRAWADVLPLQTGIQEYAMTDILAPAGAGGALEKTYPRVGELEGLKYELTLDREAVQAGEPVGARLRITGARDKPFTGLEPLMGAFAHLVGFHEDRKTILHMHPVETRRLSDEDRGGPELQFRIYTDTPGYYRLFLQVQIGGVSKFIPFGVEVGPPAS
jgi:hypothetical protein